MTNQQIRSANITDRRILRTKKSIRQAFLSLLSEYSFEDITVSALSERAGINRKTFYLHYTSTRELYDEIRREQCGRIAKLSCWKKITESDPAPYEIFLEMNQLIEEDRELYRALLSPVSGTATLQKIKEKILESEELAVIRSTHPEIDYYLDYTISGLFALYLRWLSDPHHISIEELAKIATELTRNGFGPIPEIAKKNPAARPKNPVAKLESLTQ